MAEKWIAGAVKRPGAFTKKANAAGESVQSMASKVTANPGDFSTRTVKQANLAKTFAKMGNSRSSNAKKVSSAARKARRGT